MWSKKEKEIARHAFDQALDREGLDLLRRLKETAGQAADLEDVWEIHDFLSRKRKDFGQKYDYRYSVLHFVLGRLISEGWIGLDDLEGLEEDKISKIKMIAGIR